MLRFEWLGPALLALAMTLTASTANAQTITVDGRSSFLKVPAGYDPNVPAPLVILLHGYGSNGLLQDGYMGFSTLSDEFGFLYTAPDGTLDCTSMNFWNATDSCCNFCGSTVDDSGYVIGIIDEVKSQYTVDANRVYLIGHSNGGFMSYRAACDHSGSIAAIASLAGATFADPNDCVPSEPVHTLQIHGTLDTVIAYAGGIIGASAYPSAVTTTETWAAYNGCSLTPDTSPPPLDLDAVLAGDETTVARYATGCSLNGSAELWTIVNGAHIPALSLTFAREVIEFLYAHPKAPAAPVPLPRVVLGVIGLLLASLVVKFGIRSRGESR